MVKRYKNVSLPEELLNYIDNIVGCDKFGYKTRAEFVKEAVRTSLKGLDVLNVNYKLK